MDLREKLMRRLEGGKFRLLNERMYHGRGLKRDDLRLYHELYGSQVRKWPVNPLDVIIGKMREKGAKGVIADVGCGEARIAREFANVISLDLHPAAPDVVACDMRVGIPLGDGSVDIAVCCLSMMAEDIGVPTREVSRVLRTGGWWYVAEVRSRISSVNHLAKGFESFGFEVVEIDVSNSQFVLLVLRKASEVPRRLPRIKLMPCLYKKR